MFVGMDYMAWVNTMEGLGLLIGGRTVVMSDELADHLLDDNFFMLGDSPAEDLIGFEGELRRAAFHATRRVGRTSMAVERQQQLVDQLDAELADTFDRQLPVVLRARDNAAALLRDLAEEHEVASESLAHWRTHVAEVREFVAELWVEGGPLAAAAAGWQRPPERPTDVIRFPGEQAFIADDPRRSADTDRVSLLDAEDFGRGWRRDGDDDDDPLGGYLDLAGPWEVGYLPRTGEIYALRRCGYLDDEVWLLGSGFDDDSQTRDLLSNLEQHKLEPNSLLLLTHTIRQAGQGTFVPAAQAS